MNYLSFVIAYLFLGFLALLPAPLLYFISWLFYVLLYRIIGYRKKVVNTNLRNAFPRKSKKELAQIRKKFYRNLADVLLENAVIQFYSRKRLEKMFTFKNPEIIQKYYEEKRQIITIAGHYNNWEWGPAITYTFDHLPIGVYRPLKNKYFDRAIRKARTRFGAVAVPMGNIVRALHQYIQAGEITHTGMLSDQRPIRKHVQYWTDFLNQKTAVFTGSEKLAKKFNAVVLFMNVRRLKRGLYQAEFELITENPKETEQFWITEAHTRKLEKLILEDPSNWLWSHNRWKISYERWKELEGKE